MALSTSAILSIKLNEIQNQAASVKTIAQGFNSQLAAGNVDSEWVYSFLDNAARVVSVFNSYVAIPNINTAATANIPNYSGTFTSDLAAVSSAATGCINWVVANFPKDSTNTYILAETLNANGSRTQRQFTPTQTAGLRTALQTLINAIS